MRSLTNFRGWIIALSLVATGLAGSASGALYRYQGDVTPIHPVSDLYFVHVLGDGSSTAAVAHRVADNVSDGLTVDIDITFDTATISLGDDYVPERYTFVSIYDDANDGVQVAMYPDDAWDAVDNAWSWGDAFDAGTYPEADLAAALRDGGAMSLADIGAWAKDSSSRFPVFDDVGYLVNFSIANVDGSTWAEWTEVPEPTGLMLTAIAMMPLMRRRRLR